MNGSQGHLLHVEPGGSEEGWLDVCSFGEAGLAWKECEGMWVCVALRLRTGSRRCSRQTYALAPRVMLCGRDEGHVMCERWTPLDLNMEGSRVAPRRVRRAKNPASANHRRVVPGLASLLPWCLNCLCLLAMPHHVGAVLAQACN